MLIFCYGSVKTYEKLIFVNASFEYAHVGEISVSFVVVKTVADNELVLDHATTVVGYELNLAARGLVKESAGLNAVSVSVL